MYAYASRKASNWVPDVLFSLAMDARSAQEQDSRTGSWPLHSQQKRTSQPPADASLALGRGDGDENDESGGGGERGSLRCPTCGAMSRTAASLAAHIRSVHGTGSSGSSGKGAAGTVRRVGSSEGGARAASSAPRNSSDRATGRVAVYRNSSGTAFVPPVGHQLSLRSVTFSCKGLSTSALKPLSRPHAICLSQVHPALRGRRATHRAERSGGLRCRPGLWAAEAGCTASAGAPRGRGASAS